MAKDATPIRDLIAAKREEILAIARRYGAQNVRVFGSVARGDETAQSDVDLLVNLVEAWSMLDHISMQQDLEDLLGCDVDVIVDDALQNDIIREYVVKDSVPL
jgi:hypothetical protein